MRVTIAFADAIYIYYRAEIYVYRSVMRFAHLIADRRSEVNSSTAGQYALLRAHKNAQATLLQNAYVVIVGVSHRPTGGVPPRFLAIRSVDSPHVSVRPFAPGIVFHYLKQNPIFEIAALAGTRFH